MQRLDAMLDRRWLTNAGPLVVEFEERLCEYLGVKHCIAMANATIGLEIAIRAVGMSGEVIVPAFTFIATAHALRWQDIAPVFCDIDSVTHNIDPDSVESLITRRTTGIIGVHLWGRTCDVESLEVIAARHGLALLFDSAHAFGCTHNAERVGGFGDAEVFSFHATKIINSFEGGAVATNNGDLAHKIRLMNNFGFTDFDRVEYIGTNGKMSEAAAAMGLTSLESLDDFIAVNRANHRAYARQIADIPGLALMEYDEKERSNYHYIVLDVDARQAGLDRNELVEVLHAENVSARRYFYPGCHLMEPYNSMPEARWRLPRTQEIASRVMCLPNGTAVAAPQIKKIGEILRLAQENADAVREAIRERGAKFT